MSNIHIHVVGTNALDILPSSKANSLENVVHVLKREFNLFNLVVWVEVALSVPSALSRALDAHDYG